MNKGLQTFTVYVLFSENYGKPYTGFTTNLDNRFHSHNFSNKAWTRKYRPWKFNLYQDKNEALEYEKWLKTGVGRNFIKTLSH